MKKILILGAVMLIAFVGIGDVAYAQTATTIRSQLDVGDRGSDVTRLQTYLSTNSSWYPQGLVTGYFGPLTEAAVKKFQTANGISAVGRVGPLTLSRINTLMAGGVSTGADVTAPTIFNVQVSDASSGGNTITWNTSENSRSKLYYGTTLPVMTEALAPRTEPTISGTVIADATFGSTQSITIPNLTQNSPYFYVLLSADAAGNVSVTNPATFVAK